MEESEENRLKEMGSCEGGNDDAKPEGSNVMEVVKEDTPSVENINTSSSETDVEKPSTSLSEESSKDTPPVENINNVCSETAVEQPSTSTPVENEKLDCEAEEMSDVKDANKVIPCSIILDRKEVSTYLRKKCKRKHQDKVEDENCEISSVSSEETKIRKQESVEGKTEDDIITEHTDPSRKYVCSSCTLLFNNITDMRQHSVKVHRKRLQKVKMTTKYTTCKACNEFVLNTDIKNHMKTLHKQLFENINLLKLKVFICSNCSKCFSNKTELDKHVLSIHNGEENNVSNKKLNKKSSKTKDSKNLCITCNGTFLTKSLLQLHSKHCTGVNNSNIISGKRKTRNVKQIIESSDSDAEFLCLDCELIFDSKIEYQEHFNSSECIETIKANRKTLTNKIKSNQNSLKIVAVDNKKKVVTDNVPSKKLHTTTISLLKKANEKSEVTNILKKSDITVSSSKSCTKLHPVNTTPNSWKVAAKVIGSGSKKSSTITKSSTIVKTHTKPVPKVGTINTQNKEIQKIDIKKQTQFFACKFCNYFVLTYKDLLDHMYTYHCILFKCHTCLGKFNTIKDYSNHLKKEHAMEKLNLDYNLLKNTATIYSCKKCDAAFDSEKSLDYHLILHKNYDYLFTNLNCLYCEENCSNYETLQKHVEDYHLFCKICDILFATEEKCKQHRNDHKLGAIKFYVCQYCCNTFKSIDEFNDHSSTYHKIGNLSNVSKFVVVKYPQEKITPLINQLPCPYCENCLEPKFLLLHFKSSHNLEVCDKCKYYIIKSNKKICACCIIKQKEIDENNMKIYASIINKRQIASEKYKKEKQEEEKLSKLKSESNKSNINKTNTYKVGKVGNKNRKLNEIDTLNMPELNIPTFTSTNTIHSNVHDANTHTSTVTSSNSTYVPATYTQLPVSNETTSNYKQTVPTYTPDNSQSNVIINQTFNFVPLPTTFNQTSQIPSYIYPNTHNPQTDLYLSYPSTSNNTNYSQNRDTVIKNLDYPPLPYYPKSYTSLESSLQNYSTPNTDINTRNWYTLGDNNTLSHTQKSFDYNYAQYQNTYYQDKGKSDVDYSQTHFNSQLSSNVKTNLDNSGTNTTVYDSKLPSSFQYTVVSAPNQTVFPKTAEGKSDTVTYTQYNYPEFKIDMDESHINLP